MKEPDRNIRHQRALTQPLILLLALCRFIKPSTFKIETQCFVFFKEFSLVGHHLAIKAKSHKRLCLYVILHLNLSVLVLVSTVCPPSQNI